MDYSQYPTNRADAKKLKAKYYFTGIPCSRGHVALRKTKGVCVECMKEDWAKENARRALLPRTEKLKEYGRKYYQKHKETIIARAASRPREQLNVYRKKHKQRNPDMYRDLTNIRRGRFKVCTPKWLTPEDKLEMRLKYRVAREMTKVTGERYVVDHQIPIISNVVCGFHAPWNMEIMTQEENLKKSNKLIDF